MGWITDAKSSFEGLVSSARAAATAVTESRDSILADYRQLRQGSDETANALTQSLNHLRDLVKDFSGPWKQELDLMIAALDVGAIRLDEFMVKVGDWVITTADGTTKVKDLFDQADLRGREQEIQDLIAALQRGSADIGTALEFLSRAQGQFADELERVVRAVETGDLPIQRLVDLVRQIEESFPDSDFARLGRTILGEFNRGGLR